MEQLRPWWRVIRLWVAAFPEGGEYLLIEDGAAIAHSKSLKMVRRLGMALQEYMSSRGTPAYVDLWPVDQVSTAELFEDGRDAIPPWPRYCEQRFASINLPGMRMPDTIEIASRIGGTVVRSSYIDEPAALKRGIREAAIHSIDVMAREAFDKENQPIIVKEEKRA